MGYLIIIPSDIDEEFKKLKRKNKAMHERVMRKLDEIMENPENIGQPKSNVFKNSRGVHLGSYVLIWRVEKNKIIILRFRHHNHAYKWS